ncbi:hypothetical protein ElyMa_002947200 [Elysia marginata]|uniref:HTH cro/C1-type domain-containing protein n=1 Tax=Elysia marginata TaxID=1093978 RepID=A0AAV4I7A4_9GAST|nr:hypothetical protein ElyMa_002947200 [Elysia marginata]
MALDQEESEYYIDAWRLVKGLSQKDLATTLNLSLLDAYELPKRTNNTEIARKVAESLGITIEQLKTKPTLDMIGLDAFDEIGADVGKKVRERAKRTGSTLVYKENGKMIQELADGRKKTLTSI